MTLLKSIEFAFFFARVLVKTSLHRNAFPIPNSDRPGSYSLSAIFQRSSLQSLGGFLRDEGAGGGALVAPRGGQVADLAVVPREAVDAGLDENEAVLGVLVLAVALEVLADGDGLGNSVSGGAPAGEWGRKGRGMAHLLDQVVEVLGKLGSEAWKSQCQP